MVLILKQASAQRATIINVEMHSVTFSWPKMILIGAEDVAVCIEVFYHAAFDLFPSI